MNTNLDGVDELRCLIQRKGGVAAVAYVWRANPVLREMKEAIDSGRFGRPLHLIVHYGQHFPTYRPAYREIYYNDRSLGGGAIQDAMTHFINLGEWLAGPIDRLTADADHLALEGVTVEDTVNILTRQGPVLGAYTLNQHQAPNEMTITVACERGTLFINQAHAFLDALETGVRPLCTLDEGIGTLRCNLAALACASEQAGPWRTITPIQSRLCPVRLRGALQRVLNGEGGGEK